MNAIHGQDVKEYLKTPKRWFGIRPWTRHSLVLLVAGFVYTAIGFSYIATPSETRAQALILATHWIPITVWGGVFVFGGVLTMLSARWPPTADKWGYMLLTGISALWAAAYGLGPVFADTPWSNLSGGAVWALVAFLWWAISGLLSPTRVVVIKYGRELG